MSSFPPFIREDWACSTDKWNQTGISIPFENSGNLWFINFYEIFRKISGNFSIFFREEAFMGRKKKLTPSHLSQSKNTRRQAIGAWFIVARHQKDPHIILPLDHNASLGGGNTKELVKDKKMGGWSMLCCTVLVPCPLPSSLLFHGLKFINFSMENYDSYISRKSSGKFSGHFSAEISARYLCTCSCLFLGQFLSASSLFVFGLG